MGAGIGGKGFYHTLIILSPPRGRYQALINQNSPRRCQHHQVLSYENCLKNGLKIIKLIYVVVKFQKNET